MANYVLNNYQSNSTLQAIQHHLREAYSLAICSNGPYKDCGTHEKLWESFNRFAKKVMFRK